MFRSLRQIHCWSFGWRCSKLNDVVDAHILKILNWLKRGSPTENLLTLNLHSSQNQDLRMYSINLGLNHKVFQWYEFLICYLLLFLPVPQVEVALLGGVSNKTGEALLDLLTECFHWRKLNNY